MRIACYSLTRDRLNYTQHCFASLREKAGHEFDHYIVDNGSRDGTVGWLGREYKPKWIYPFGENRGISIASNMALRAILVHSYDLVLKIDNDCKVTSDGILKAFADIYAHEDAQRWALSPRVEGINRQPARARHQGVGGRNVGSTAIIGGLFHVLPAHIYRQYYMGGGYPEDLPLARGQDDHLCEWLRQHKYSKGYVEDLVVEHYRGTDQQAVDYPDYFQRKWDVEEKHPYGSQP